MPQEAPVVCQPSEIFYSEESGKKQFAERRKPDISLIMPAFNEDQQIGNTILEAKRALAEAGLSNEIIVVDDGSLDLTAEIAHEFGANVLKLEHNRGYGYALIEGMKVARGKFIVITDASGINDPKDIQKLVQPLLLGIDVVSGSRFLKGSVLRPYSVSSRRHFSILLADLIISMITGIHVSDAVGNFKAFRRDVPRRLNLHSQGFEMPSEIIVKAIRGGLRYQEVPITSRTRSNSYSWVHNWIEVFRILKTIFRSSVDVRP